MEGVVNRSFAGGEGLDVCTLLTWSRFGRLVYGCLRSAVSERAERVYVFGRVPMSFEMFGDGFWLAGGVLMGKKEGLRFEVYCCDGWKNGGRRYERFRR